MKRALFVGFLASVLAAGCGTGTQQSPARLSGIYDLIQAGNFLFVTSSNRDELRAIDLTPERPLFARAPNPVEPLAVPVLKQPVQTATDIRFDTPDGDGNPDGQRRGGSFVFARGVASTEISIVGTAPEQLVELRRLLTAGTVTSFASRGSADGTAILYYATLVGTGSELWEQRLPTAAALFEDPNLPIEAPRRLLSLTDASVVSMIVMPTADEIVVATRAPDAAAGRTFLLNASTLAERVMDFGAPVRELATHSRAFAVESTLAEGTRVFGVLDEAACEGLDTCRGIVAVESATGVRSLDRSGQPMLPIGGGEPLIRGIDFAPSGTQLRDVGLTTSTGQALLGMFTTSNGSIFFFDAFGLTHLDINPGGAGANVRYDAPAGSAEGTQGRAIPEGVGPLDLAAGNGRARDENIRVTPEGTIPGLTSLATTDADGNRLSAPADVAARAAVGDFVVIRTGDVDCERVLEAIEPGTPATETSPETPAVLVVTGGAECVGRSSYTVRVSGAQPYVVDGGVTGYMGRVGDGEAFEFAGTVRFRPDNFEPDAPQLRFRMGTRDPEFRRDESFIINTFTGFTPYYLSVASNSNQLRTYYAGVVRFAPQTGRLFVAFPTQDPLTTSRYLGDFVLEINPASVLAGQANTADIAIYR